MSTKPLILVADDDGNVRTALATRLVQSGFDVAGAGDAKTAIELFDHRHPAAAVLDIHMPGDDGFSVCEHIRKSGSSIPVVFLTGSDNSIIQKHLPTLTNTVGANHFLSKPYDGKILAAMLHDAVATPVAS